MFLMFSGTHATSCTVTSTPILKTGCMWVKRKFGKFRGAFGMNSVAILMSRLCTPFLGHMW